MYWNSELSGAELPFQALYGKRILNSIDIDYHVTETAAFGEYKRYDAGESIFSQDLLEDKVFYCVCPMISLIVATIFVDVHHHRGLRMLCVRYNANICLGCG